MYRTHNCGELNISDINKNIILCGWISVIRDKGSIIWIDIRDRYGITQITLDQDCPSKLFKIVRNINREYVIKVKGTVKKRLSPNINIKTGEIEIIPFEIKIINKSKIPPFKIENNTDGNEELRMKFRYLDLRRDIIKNKIILRSNVVHEIRQKLKKNDFIEVETPILIKSTPEGARDFLVPSRINYGKFYALPQSPQIFKQLLMIGGIDKYYQIAKCFRDEDLRADRQPEFTQIDCEMSFINQNDIMIFFENLIKEIIEKFTGYTIKTIPILKYHECIEKYGSDKPDIRYGMEFKQINHLLNYNKKSPFKCGETIIGFKCSNLKKLSNNELEKLNDFVKNEQIKSKGLIWIKHTNDNIYKSSLKSYNQDDLKIIANYFNSKIGDIIMIMYGNNNIRSKASYLRNKMIQFHTPLDNFSAIWVTEFPLFELDKDNQIKSVHHPFTAPLDNQIEYLDNNPLIVRSKSYDLVINGNEIGGGSIRIHNYDIQNKIFKILKMTKDKIKDFKFLLEAFNYGVPPHGGIAFGLDRLISIIDKGSNIREYIAFPKNNLGKDLMIECPSIIDNNLLKDLNIRIIN